MLLQTRKEHGTDTYVLFLDLVKAFDTVNRELLLEILAAYGIPQTLIDVIAKLYTDIFVQFNIDGVKKILRITHRGQTGRQPSTHPIHLCNASSS